MSNREYVYARRVWDRVLDGGCYCVSVACNHPAAPHHTRNVRITDYISCYLIRDARSAQGRRAGAAPCLEFIRFCLLSLCRYTEAFLSKRLGEAQCPQSKWTRNTHATCIDPRWKLGGGGIRFLRAALGIHAHGSCPYCQSRVPMGTIQLLYWRVMRLALLKGADGFLWRACQQKRGKGGERLEKGGFKNKKKKERGIKIGRVLRRL